MIAGGRCSRRQGLAVLALLGLSGPALGQARLPLPDLQTVEPFRGTAHPRIDELTTAHPPLWRQDDLREPDLSRPRRSLRTLPGTLIGTVRASDRPATGPVDRIPALYAALRACWKLPMGADRLETTVRVAFRRDGRVVGEPRVTYRSPGPEGARETLSRSVVAAVNDCPSLAFSPSFGQAIAGRPVAIRFVDDRTP
ncbi:hypothetical protein [Salinarimonas soli]|uniref:TonB C-terminal domain-containing protein n=1 Tax=Salinarimonas soli TaxID=1638099 RepID=A0A5B2V975_9HYPH|nr:hypothetical protein [Salinarimonas soli]KAA2235386.1 hypothetical protein F0L46_20470 [Salinarimonas soli]